MYRPVGPRELDLIRQADWRCFPPRLPEQPIFYPVLNENYARQIARDWNAKANGAGFVTKFAVSTDYLKNFEIHIVGGSEHAEYWIPADQLNEFNQQIVGRIIVISEFPSEHSKMSANWIKVYDLSQDRETVALIEKASQQTAEFGFVPEVAVFGSDEWWAAVEDGRIEQHTIEGVITRLYMSGHGDWPEFELSFGKEITRWTRLGSHNAYRVGNGSYRLCPSAT